MHMIGVKQSARTRHLIVIGWIYNTTVDSSHLFYELWSDVCAIPQVVRHGVPST